MGDAYLPGAALRHADEVGQSRQVDEDTVLGLVRQRKAKRGLPVVCLIAEMEEKGLVSPRYHRTDL